MQLMISRKLSDIRIAAVPCKLGKYYSYCLYVVVFDIDNVISGAVMELGKSLKCLSNSVVLTSN